MPLLNFTYSHASLLSGKHALQLAMVFENTYGLHNLITVTTHAPSPKHIKLHKITYIFLQVVLFYHQESHNIIMLVIFVSSLLKKRTSLNISYANHCKIVSALTPALASFQRCHN